MPFRAIEKDTGDDGGNSGELSEEVVPVGSKEYYAGFISRDMSTEPEERVTGDALLFPILKFVGGSFVIIGALLVAFLASNGLLSN